MWNIAQGLAFIWNFQYPNFLYIIISPFHTNIKKKKTLWLFVMDGVQLSQGYSHYKETVYFLPLSPMKSWYSFDWPWKDERQSWPWSHPVVLNPGPLDWEFSTLTTRPLLRSLFAWFSIVLLNWLNNWSRFAGCFKTNVL